MMAITGVLLAGCGARWNDLIVAETARFEQVGHPRVALHPQYRAERAAVESCFQGTYRYGVTAAEGCRLLAGEVAERNPAAAAMLALASCRADTPDESACPLAMELVRDLGDAGRLSELTAYDLEQVPVACERGRVHSVCVALAEWNEAVAYGAAAPVPALGLSGSEADIARLAASVEETRSIGEQRLAEARETNAEQRAQWDEARRLEAEAHQRTMRAIGAVVGAAARTAASAAAAIQAQQRGTTGIQPRVSAATGTAFEPTPEYLRTLAPPRPEPPGGGGTCTPAAMNSCQRTANGTSQRDAYCAAAYTAQCFLNNGCYREAGAATAVTRAQLQQVIDNANDMARQLGGGPC